MSSVRTDDLAALPITALMDRNASIDWSALDEVVLGCANQAGEDNRNVARMAVLLSGLPDTVPPVTVNRRCASGMDAVIAAARRIQVGEAELVIAGGIESMSRSPLVMPKADTPFSRRAEIFDTTIGWRFVNPRIEADFGTDSMPETAENVAAQWDVTREDQDALALSSQTRAFAARAAGRFAQEITPVTVRNGRRGEAVISDDEHIRHTTIETLASLPTPFRENGTVTAGNASGVNDGAAALLLASERAVERCGLTPLAEYECAAHVGVAPCVMGIGPVDAMRQAAARAGRDLNDYHLIELNEAFAAQAIAVCRELSLDPMDAHINPNGGAIALGHPLGMTGARLIGTAARELKITGKDSALCSLCVGVGQGVAVSLRCA